MPGETFLGAKFWKKGTKIEGVISGTFQTEIGTSYNAHLKTPENVDGEKTDRVSIGGLKGQYVNVGCMIWTISPRVHKTGRETSDRLFP